MTTISYVYRGMRDHAAEAERFGTVGVRVSELLEKRGTSLKEFCKKTGTNPVVAKRVIYGQAWPSQQMIARLCSFLNCAPGDFLVYNHDN